VNGALDDTRQDNLQHAGIGVPQHWSTRGSFLIAGVVGAVWAAIVPYARANTGIDDATLGLLLLCLGAGSMMTMPVAGALVPRFGCRSLITVAAVLVAALLPVLATADSLTLLVVSLLVFGGSLGALDVVMNVQAIVVERAEQRPIMSGFHGMFSLGGILGAGSMSMLLVLGASPPLAACLIAACLVALLLGTRRHLLPGGNRHNGPAFAWPRGIVLLIGAMCCISFLAEGAVLDWSAVFLTTQRGFPAAYGGIGYAAFSTTMTAGRLLGDRIVARLGGRRVVMVSGAIAAAGFAVAALVPSWPASILGDALIGVGCSNIVPVLFTAAGRQTVMPENIAVPAISTLGYLGILAGPAGIGFIAHAASLAGAFLVVAAMMLLVGAGGARLSLDQDDSTKAREGC
jgi:predicted MFS family arabinose efflux permease